MVQERDRQDSTSPAEGVTPDPDVPLYTVTEIARSLRMSKMTVYRLIHDGELKAIRIRGSYRIAETSLNDYLRGAAREDRKARPHNPNA